MTHVCRLHETILLALRRLPCVPATTPVANIRAVFMILFSLCIEAAIFSNAI